MLRQQRKLMVATHQYLWQVNLPEMSVDNDGNISTSVSLTTSFVFKFF